MFARYIPAYAENGVRSVVKEEDIKIREREMRMVPNSISEIKNSKYFIVPSLLKKY